MWSGYIWGACTQARNIVLVKYFSSLVTNFDIFKTFLIEN